MITILKRAYETFFGAGDAAVTVPPMDGALLPNHALDHADCVAALASPDNLVLSGTDLLFSSGRSLYVLDEGNSPRILETFEGDVLALAADRTRGLAIAVSGKGITFRGGTLDGQSISQGFGRADCVTALAFDTQGGLLVASGSSQHSADAWSRDLLLLGKSGAIWRIDATGRSSQIMSGLAWPSGIAALSDRRVIVSESWRHRLIQLGDDRKIVADNLPAYPGRISEADGGGFWLSMFAPRRQMIEFVLREPTFRNRMMAEIEPELWMAPALSSGKTFREPLQGGAVKQLGVLKPWAPSRSYGLIARLDDNFIPGMSYHSRADGVRHGITSGVSIGDRLLVTSKGGDVLLSLSTEAIPGAAE